MLAGSGVAEPVATIGRSCASAAYYASKRFGPSAMIVPLDFQKFLIQGFIRRAPQNLIILATLSDANPIRMSQDCIRLKSKGQPGIVSTRLTLH